MVKNSSEYMKDHISGLRGKNEHMIDHVIQLDTT